MHEGNRRVLGKLLAVVVVGAVGLAAVGGADAWLSPRPAPAKVATCAHAPLPSQTVNVIAPDGTLVVLPRNLLAGHVANGGEISMHGGMVDVDARGYQCTYSAVRLLEDLRLEEDAARETEVAEKRRQQDAQRKEAVRVAAQHRAQSEALLEALKRSAEEANREAYGSSPPELTAPHVDEGGSPSALVGEAPAVAYGGGYLAPASRAGTAVHVNGYTKSNGTYVAPHTRSAPGGRR